MRDQPLFKDSGFESLDEWLDHLEEMWREEAGLESLGLEHLRAVAASTLDAGNGKGARHARQVGLRLPGKDYELLVELCERYAVPPATMARILVIRAVRAEEQLADADD